MKSILLLPFALVLPLSAGTSAKQTIAPAAQESCLFSWFAGGSVGYLTEFEEPMYNLHVGTDTCWNVVGWNVALFGEVGYTQKDDSFSGQDRQSTPPRSNNFDIDSMSSGLQYLSNIGAGRTGYDLDVMPLTLNVKLERLLTGNLNAYFGAGLGMALVDLDINAGRFGNYSDSDWVFTAQAFAGLNYNVNANVEIYGGARWVYFDKAELSDGGESASLDLGSDCLLELGARYNF